MLVNISDKLRKQHCGYRCFSISKYILTFYGINNNMASTKETKLEMCACSVIAGTI